MQPVDAADLTIGDGHPPRIMGVLNVSTESPYAPSVYDDPAMAARYVEDELVDEGADIVDVGLESANKRYDVLSADQELDRLETAIAVVERVESDVVFSIETRYHEVADEALSRGFDAVNDICGFADPDLPAVCEAHDAAVFKMASPPDLARPGAVEETDWVARKGEEWATEADYVDMVYEALKQHGLTDKTIVDPAFGGWSETQTLEDDRETLRRLREFRGLDQPILVSINRKNFLKAIADRDTAQALPVSLAATSLAVERGAHVIRTHDVAETRDAALVGAAFTRDRTHTSDLEELDVTRVEEAERHLERVGGPVGDAPGAVSRAFEIRGLTPAERRAVVDLASGTGVVVSGDGPLFVAGTLAGLRALGRQLSDADDPPTPLAGRLLAVR
jgi:dihydropteroate synthase